MSSTRYLAFVTRTDPDAQTQRRGQIALLRHRSAVVTEREQKDFLILEIALTKTRERKLRAEIAAGTPRRLGVLDPQTSTLSAALADALADPTAARKQIETTWTEIEQHTITAELDAQSADEADE